MLRFCARRSGPSFESDEHFDESLEPQAGSDNIFAKGSVIRRNDTNNHPEETNFSRETPNPACETQDILCEDINLSSEPAFRVLKGSNFTNDRKIITNCHKNQNSRSNFLLKVTYIGLAALCSFGDRIFFTIFRKPYAARPAQTIDNDASIQLACELH
jgi:hypothetical protein